MEKIVIMGRKGEARIRTKGGRVGLLQRIIRLNCSWMFWPRYYYCRDLSFEYLAFLESYVVMRE